MIRIADQYQIEMYDPQRARLLGRMPIEVDFLPAAEALALDQLRAGQTPDDDVRIEPLWHERSGPPKVRGFCAVTPDGATRKFSLTYFSPYADRVASQFVSSGDLEAGDVFEYSVQAAPRASEAAPRRTFRVSASAPAVPVHSAALHPLMARALLMGVDEARDFPVFAHWNVLEECAVLTRRAGAMETGGVLIGRICRDEAAGELFLLITAQIAAPAQGALTKLSFNADTWSSVQSAIDQRSTKELWLGWWHSHSYTKHESSKPQAAEGAASRGRQPASAFLSEEDRLLHRTIFPRAYSIALLITDSPDSGMSWAAFGWRGGMIVGRAFHLVDVPLPEEFTTLGENHATQSNHAAIAG
jgi:hypothetical protein